MHIVLLKKNPKLLILQSFPYKNYLVNILNGSMFYLVNGQSPFIKFPVIIYFVFFLIKYHYSGYSCVWTLMYMLDLPVLTLSTVSHSVASVGSLSTN